jgi:hypothetical protein
MARIIRDAVLSSRAARSRLKSSGQPYYRAIEHGLHLGYRKPLAGAGRWLARHYLGEGRYRLYKIGVADDLSDADGRVVLSFRQAQVAARQLLQGINPVKATLSQYVTEKALDLLARDIEPGGYLYRHYHPNGDLLYVGFSLQPLRRQDQHLKGADWRNMISYILIEPFETRKQAIAAEEAAIRDEFPRFNTTHNKRRHPFQEAARVQGKGFDL